MNRFYYLIDKINSSKFIEEPFKHLYIENFFKKEDFDEIISDHQISTSMFESTEELIFKLINEYSYKVQPFPGCTTNVKEYLEWVNTKKIIKGIEKDQDLIEGFGLVLRLNSYRSRVLADLINFLNSEEWHKCLTNKFQKYHKITSVDTAIQKYLTGYEISPHPDIRRKCLTYMININPFLNSENQNLHTHFLKFVDDKKWIYNFWENNEHIDRCWVPWSWAETVFKQEKNNSITVFSPDNNTLHAVKLNYNHNTYQRTQLYGNLWYSSSKLKKNHWSDLKKQETKNDTDFYRI